MNWVVFQDRKEIGRFEERNEAVQFIWNIIGFYEGASPHFSGLFYFPNFPYLAL